MLIVTNVETDGKLMGYFVYGSPTPQTVEQTAAGYHQWLDTVAGDTLTYSYPRGTTTVQFSGDNLFLTQRANANGNVRTRLATCGRGALGQALRITGN
jgi:hypothetical protein